MNKQHIVTFYHEYPKNKSVTTYLKNHVRNAIRSNDKLQDVDKKILLNWPIVYIHGWHRQTGEICIYVGETNDLAQRLGQHALVDDFYYADEDWHGEWLQAIESGMAFSWFFGSETMNKSMCLDLENSLVILLEQCNIRVKTKTSSAQRAYSNKLYRDDLLEEVWGELAKKLSLYPYNKLYKEGLSKIKKAYDDYTPMLEFKCIKPDENGEFSEELLKKTEFIDYPTVYIYIWKNKNKVYTYVGETEKIDVRSKQHSKKKEEWESWQSEWNVASENNEAYLCVFNHRDFNKSMTLDIENRLINYTAFLETGRNLRYNEQGSYDNKDKMFNIFKDILDKLLDWQKEKGKEYQIFKPLEIVREQCISLASPFYQLTSEQEKAKINIFNEISKTLDDGKSNPELLIVYGGAGTGKTVLISSLLFSLIDAKVSCKLMVNNEELAPAYKKMIDIWKLGSDVSDKGKNIVYYASDYINENEEHDVLLVDEGHLLNTVAHMRAKTQLDKIVCKAKVVVFVFDPLQFIDKFKKWEGDFSSAEKVKLAFDKLYREEYKINNINVKVYELSEQQRMRCAPETQKWILDLTKSGSIIEPFPGGNISKREDEQFIAVNDRENYMVAVCKDPCVLQQIAAEFRTQDKDSMMIATYDWKYELGESTIKLSHGKKSVQLHWHITGSGAKKKDDVEKLSLTSWIKQAEVDEVGAIHDIQGFDLNYAIVIIGPSIQYSPWRVRKHGSGKERYIEKGIQVNVKKHRSNHDITLILNELRVLLTRGAKGLIIYSVDEKLRNALYHALQGE